MVKKGQKINSVDENFIFSQCIKDLKIGLFPLSIDQALLISALLYQIQFGDSTDSNFEYDAIKKLNLLGTINSLKSISLVSSKLKRRRLRKRTKNYKERKHIIVSFNF